MPTIPLHPPAPVPSLDYTTPPMIPSHPDPDPYFLCLPRSPFAVMSLQREREYLYVTKYVYIPIRSVHGKSKISPLFPSLSPSLPLSL